MANTERIKILCAHLRPAETFADVGCDHGYMSEYMLKNGLCGKLYFSDVSKGSLEKAKKRLATYVAEEKAVGVLGDGFYGIPHDTEEVLIAGMGGSEIVDILSHEKYGFLPRRFVFQPMLDGEKLRRYLIARGAYLERDYTFESDGKPYDCIVGRRRGENEKAQDYTRGEYAFGYENMREKSAAFLGRLKEKLARAEKYLGGENLSDVSRGELCARRDFLRGVITGEID